MVSNDRKFWDWHSRNLIGQLIDAREKDGESSVRVALRLIKVETSEVIWAATVEGVYETPLVEPEVTMDMRKALTLAAEDTVKALDAKAAGYQALLMPFKGEFGKTTRDIFLSALSKADKKVTVLALPDEGDDRRVARFLRNRVENGKGINSSVLQWIVKKSQNGNETTKCAILDGKVVTQVDSFKGKPAGRQSLMCNSRTLITASRWFHLSAVQAYASRRWTGRILPGGIKSSLICRAG